MKRTSKYIVVLFWLVIGLNPLYSQINHSHNIIISFLQLKEHFNLGMVFNGVQLEYRYGLTWKIREHEILYQPKLGFGVGFNHGLIATQIHIAPISVTWTMPFYEQNGHTLRGGANFITDYNYQKYNEFHFTNLFWTSEIGLSSVIRYSYQWNNKRINANWLNSLFGFTSHCQGYDSIFRDVFPDNVFVKPHEDMKFGSFNEYNHTNISLEFVPNIYKIHSFVYEIDYLGFFKGVQFHRINHNLIWRMSL